MKVNKMVLYPLGAIVVVALFWGALAVVQNARRSTAVGPEHTTPQANPLAVENQKPGTSQPSAPSAEESAKPPAVAADNRRFWLGAKVRERTIEADEGEPPTRAAEVLDVSPGSPAARAGLQKGDMIVGTQRRPLAGVKDFEDTLAAASPDASLSLQVLRSGEPLELNIARGGASSAGSTTVQEASSENPLASTGGLASQGRTGIFINGREVAPPEAQQLKATYGYLAPPGRYWYDSRSGLYGTMGYEAAGFMRPGHNFGPLPSNASNGNTGVFINGRQINMNEAMYCQRLFGAVYQGHWWLDGRTGNMGAEGNPTPLVNVFVALQHAQRSSQGGSYGWHSNATGASGGSSGGCSYVSIPGSGTVMSGNCD